MTLYIVATPIGNLADITLRALETLKNVDKILCEDTRRTRQLLGAYNISKPLDSLHQHTTPEKLERVVADLGAGLDMAYVSDAGTPGISDPGGVLVERARKQGVQIVPIPGPSAVTTLLSAAGVPADSFWFTGFLPTKKGRQTKLKEILNFPDTVVCYETGPRLLRLCRELSELGGSGVTLTVGRELTKKFEEIVVGSPEQIREYFTKNKPQGEFVLILTK